MNEAREPLNLIGDYQRSIGSKGRVTLPTELGQIVEYGSVYLLNPFASIPRLGFLIPEGAIHTRYSPRNPTDPNFTIDDVLTPTPTPIKFQKGRGHRFCLPTPMAGFDQVLFRGRNDHILVYSGTPEQLEKEVQDYAQRR